MILIEKAVFGDANMLPITAVYATDEEYHKLMRLAFNISEEFIELL